MWSLVDLLDGCMPIWCKRVFKTKHDVEGHVEIYEARLVAKGYG